MEQLIHYVWKHKLFSLSELRTIDGQRVEVIDVGLPNYNAGPDFFNSKIKLGDTVWVGNVEIHKKSSDWFVHKHECDPNYNNVILHVVEQADTNVKTLKGDIPPQIELSIPDQVMDNFQTLQAEDKYPPCYKIIPKLNNLYLHSWLSALQTERLEERTKAIQERVEACDGDWESAFFVTMARNYGFGINGEAFEQWAKSVPLSQIGRHRDDVFQIEAIFMGQAGLLNEQLTIYKNKDKIATDSYFLKLKEEYKYLSHKFNISPIDYSLWRFLRLRPQNFPHIRIAQLVHLYCQQKARLSNLTHCKSIDELRELLQTQVTPYWETHYTFGSESEHNPKHLSKSSIDLLIINTVVPMLFAYGRHRLSEELCDKAYSYWEALRSENNHIVRMWKEVGLKVSTAGDSQALIQLKRAYCERKDCLRCRIGYEYLKAK